MSRTGVQLLGDLLNHYRKEYGIDPVRGGHSFIVSADGAAVFFREIFGSLGTLKDTEITNEQDILFRFKRIPVRLRFESAPGACYLIKDSELPQRTCCDATSASSVMVALTRTLA